MQRLWADRQLNFLVAINLIALLAGVLLTGRNFASLYNLQSMVPRCRNSGCWRSA